MKTAADWHARGLSFFEKGDFQEARNMFMLALKAEGNNPRYLLDYGQAYVELGQYDKALRLFSTALELDPNSVTGNYRLANLYKQFGKVDEAITSYGRALEADPSFAAAYNNRGGALQIIGDVAAAIADYRHAIAINPSLTEAYLNLGRLLDAGEDFSAAAEVYRQALVVGLNPGLFNHLLLSVSGESSEKAPIGYVQAIFDDYAPTFDLHLTRGLGYSLPTQIGAIVNALSSGRGAGLVVVDLGCGTGLCGAQLAGSATHLVGVDASPGMLEQADRRGIYHDLVEADIERYLPELAGQSVDALIAADVFIYVGRLDKLFSEAARVLLPEGTFVFSIECLAGEGDYLLQRTGRYQHATAYIEKLAAGAGLGVAHCTPIDLRLERAVPVPGMLFTLNKTSA